MSDIRNDENVQHGIDDNAHHDATKGLELGGLGGGAVGAIAGSILGPVGTLVGALIGGSVGAVASGAAVAAVDQVDNDNTVSGVGTGATLKDGEHVGTTTGTYSGSPSGDYERGSYVGGSDLSDTAGAGGHNVVTGEHAHTGAGKTGLAEGAVAGGLLGAAVGGPVGAVVGGTLGSLAGGVAGDASEAATTGTYGTGVNMADTSAGIHTGGTHTGYETDERYSTLTGGDYATRPYGTYEGRSISRTDYNSLPENDRMKVQLVEEELHVDKEVRQIGEVQIGKRVVSEQVSVPVTLEREEVIIHRRDVSGGAAGTIGAD